MLRLPTAPGGGLVDDFPRQARTAYLVGWACTDGPLTARVEAGCAVAVALAVEHQHEPGILEATMDLGALEGVWAGIYQRREHLTQQWIRKISAAWRKFVAHIDLDTQIRDFRQRASAPRESDDQPDVDAAAHAQARRMLHGAIDPAAVAYRDLIDTTADALRDADAEGKTGALAAAAEQAGHGPISFDLAFQDARDALGDLDQYWGDAGGWIGKIVNGNAADLGDALLRVWNDGGDFDAMRDAASDVLSGTDIRAIDTLIDQAMSQSFSRGALRLYGSEGLATVDFVTAGGSRVCPRCLDAEAGNPWPIDRAPHPGLHPFCRCILQPSDPLQAIRSLDLSQYLVDS